jgi:hypothetical protein
MAWWDEKADRLQQSVISADIENLHKFQHDDDHVRSSVVHARQDMVLLVSQRSSLNKQVRTVKILLAAIAILLFGLVLKV